MTVAILAPDEQTASAYVGRITRQSQGKHGSRGALWFVTITSPQWIDGVDSIGASTWLAPGDAPDWVQAKRENLKHSLLAHAERNQLSTDGLEPYLTTLLQGVQP